MELSRALENGRWVSVKEDSAVALGWGLSLAAFLFGVLVGWGLLIGDELGRVNLLYLLLLFVVWPILTLVFSARSLISKNHNNVVRTLIKLLPWPKSWVSPYQQLIRHELQQPWLFCQAQLLALCFTLGSLIAFALLLLASDLNFVWRSTLLSAENLLPVLNFIATPWWFYSDAQPSMELLLQTRDSRLTSAVLDSQVYGYWWRYLLAAQCVYALIPRLLMLMLGRWWLTGVVQQQNALGTNNQNQAPLLNPQPRAADLARVERVGSIAAGQKLDDYALVCWADLPLQLLLELEQILGKAKKSFMAGPFVADLGSGLEQEQLAAAYDGVKLVVVAAWEPPMGELKDFLLTGKGYILPLDWEGEVRRPVSELHLNEWRRFCFSLGSWQLIQLEHDAAIGAADE